MKKILFSLLFLFFLGSGFCIEACADDLISAALIAKNEYSSIEYYKISSIYSKGMIVEFEDSIKDGFFLHPGESKILNYSISLPFEGNYFAEFSISDSRGNAKKERHEFAVSSCHEVEIEIIPESQNYCLRQMMPYNATIKNTGKYEENLSISMNNEIFNISLMPNESKKYELLFYSTSLNNNIASIIASNEFLSQTKEYYFNSRNCDKTGVVFESLKACAGESIQSEITIKNIGFSQDAYQIINSSSNIIIEPQSFILNAGEEKKIPFSLKSGCNELGLKNGEILLYSLNNEYIKSIVSYEALNCHDFKIIQNNDFNDYCENDNKSISFEIKNTGLLSDSYIALAIYGTNSQEFAFSLEPKESFKIDMLEYFNYSGTADAELIVLSNSICEKEANVSKKINVLEFNECYSGKMELQKFFRANAQIKIENNGTRQNEYDLSIFNHSIISSSSFILNAGESKEFQLYGLNEIMNDYGISAFSASLEGNGIMIEQTTNYAESITAMAMLAASENYHLIGILLLIILLGFFIKNNILKQTKNNNLS